MPAKPNILHMLVPDARVSPFDVNMAIDAGFGHVIPYPTVTLDDMVNLVQDAIFSRGPTGVRHTGIFIGGRDPWMALDMLEASRSAMVPPFEVAVFADPSGGYTTAAALVAVVDARLHEAGVSAGLNGTEVAIFGGTGPVGVVSAVLAADAGAGVTIVSHRSEKVAREHADYVSERFGVKVAGADGSTPEARGRVLESAQAVMSTAKAGVQILSEKELMTAPELRVAADVNAVPPLGLEGIGVTDKGKVLEGSARGAIGVGALGVGDIKYQTQYRLFQDMLAAKGAVYLEFRAAMERATELLA